MAITATPYKNLLTRFYKDHTLKRLQELLAISKAELLLDRLDDMTLNPEIRRYGRLKTLFSEFDVIQLTDAIRRYYPDATV